MGNGERFLTAVFTLIFTVILGGFLLMIALGVLHSEVPEVPALSFQASMAVACIAAVIFPTRSGS